MAASAGGRVSSRSLFSFTDRIEYAYAAAHMVIARAGALTLAEIAAAGLPSILVPYPFAAGDHQTKNAALFEKAGAALVVSDSGLKEINLLQEAVRLFMDGKTASMTRAVEELRQKRARPAADLIVDEILTILNISRGAK